MHQATKRVTTILLGILRYLDASDVHDPAANKPPMPICKSYANLPIPALLHFLSEPMVKTFGSLLPFPTTTVYTCGKVIGPVKPA